jgi:UDP-N-acetylmuramoyl-tripeptide--D-alanyl-D-alanine ligase
MNEVRLTPAWVARAADGAVRSGPAEIELANVVTDSRTLGAGDLFVALRGPRFDGHAFLVEAFARGAAAVVVDRGREIPSLPRGGAVIEVADALIALQDLARAVRRAVGTTVVAITGSAGKTTTKEAIAECLSTRFRVVRNKGNLNNHIGLPLSLIELRSAPDVAVMELGMNHSGEISTLVGIAEPNVRVWTNVGDAHLGFFASPDAIADAKAEILERANERSVLVCNADDPRITARVGRFPGRVVTFGLDTPATVRALRVEDRGLLGMAADVVTPQGEQRIQTPLLGRGNLANLLAAAAVAADMGVSLDAIASVAARLQPTGRRGVVRRLPHGVTLVDDSYNSSPSALLAALDVLGHVQDARRVAVLGEMLELGEHSIALHEKCGRAAAGARIGLLVTVGGAPANALADAAIAAGMPVGCVHHFDTSVLAADAVAREVRAGDVVLVKGSRGVATDVIVERLAAGRA